MTHWLICSCGKKKRVPKSRAHLQFCSQECYLASLKLDKAQVDRMVRAGWNKRQMAQAVGLSYPQFRRRFASDYLCKA